MPTSSAGRTSSARAGVTLIEMVVVMAIIGLMLAITAPSITAGIDSVRLSTASDNISSFLNSTVDHANRRQQPVELVISPKDNKISAYANDNFSRVLDLPDGITIEAVTPKIQDDPDPVRRLMLLPGGTVPGIGIQFANQHGARRVVRLDPMTGFPRVEAPTEPRP